ncbi:30-kDa cleavage and polyadenylation specificity factor 30 [Yarrowia sp. B02]|nr:30-kDa cleavage and polyadenylation specificity factor 30 [Yarrowia sp. B02]
MSSANPPSYNDLDEYQEQYQEQYRQQPIPDQLRQQQLPPLPAYDHQQPHLPLVYPVPVPICSYYPPPVASYTQPKPKRKRKPSKPKVPQSLPPSARPKPRQSAYALWVGNIPSNSPIDSLRTLFATKDIESIFMIPRSRCAFVNYKSEEGVVAGIEAFNQRGGQIRSNKLVVKRRSKDPDTDSPEPLTDSERSQTSSPPPTDRYFVCKSLTVRDLLVSRENSMWSTQSHNEAMLNKAFRDGSNVYLIFSANRTGEFFGCAKMIEPIPPKEKTVSNVHNTAASTQHVYSPVITMTPSSGDIPAGRIVHDVERASLFWEVLDSVSEPLEEESNWTSPFRIQWLGDQNQRVHFSETRHLRNSLNSGREVKVARDGTEIEPRVGRTIVDMFN